MLDEPVLAFETCDPPTGYLRASKVHGAKIFEYAEQWGVTAENVEQKVEEIQWMNTILYGIHGHSDGSDFNADFFL